LELEEQDDQRQSYQERHDSHKHNGDVPNHNGCGREPRHQHNGSDKKGQKPYRHTNDHHLGALCGSLFSGQSTGFP
jgi:hypothetical protein